MWISLVELVELLGKDTATLLTRVSGGRRLYVPATEDEARALINTIGIEGTRALCAAYPTTWITVPNGNRPAPQKDRILDLLAQGLDKRDIAKECGVTERYVYALARGAPSHKAKRRLDQWTLPI